MDLPGDFLIGRLLRRCRNGEEQALVELLDLTWSSAHKMVGCVTGRDDTDDVLHRAFVEIWQLARAGRLAGPHPSSDVLAVIHRHAEMALDPAPSAA